MSFEWKDRYKLNIEEVDRQHQKLFEIGGRAYDLTLLSNAFDRYDEIVAVIDELLAYTEYHFKFEEDFLTQYNYPLLTQHLSEHTYYVAKIKSLSSGDLDKNQVKTLQDIVDFLSQWISSHIVLEDRKYTSFLKEKGISL